MRDPNRIDIFCAELARVWKQNCPDWRFGQLMSNVLGAIQPDPFYVEDDVMLDVFKAYFSEDEDCDSCKL